MRHRTVKLSESDGEIADLWIQNQIKAPKTQLIRPFKFFIWSVMEQSQAYVITRGQLQMAREGKKWLRLHTNGLFWCFKKWINHSSSSCRVNCTTPEAMKSSENSRHRERKWRHRSGRKVVCTKSDEHVKGMDISQCRDWLQSCCILQWS